MAKKKYPMVYEIPKPTLLKILDVMGYYFIVPKATVVIVGDYLRVAVALQYERRVMNTPIVVAKGRGLIAERIVGIANKNNVVVKENPPLANLLYKRIEVKQEISPPFYEVMASIITHVFRLKGVSYEEEEI